MHAILMLLGSAILIGSSMIAGLRLHLFLERFAPQLASSPLMRHRLVLAGLVIGVAVAAQSFGLWS